MTKIKRIEAYDFNNEKIIIDTNILLLIFRVSTNDDGRTPYEDKLSNIFFEIYENNHNAWLINQSILSEFINKSLRNFWESYKEDTNNPKLPYKSFFEKNEIITGYRDTDDFKNKYKLVLVSVEEILSLTTLISSSVNATKKAALKKYRGLDLTDEEIIQDALENNAMIWTKDKDYLNAKESNKLTILK